VALAALANHCLGLSVREVLNALLGVEVELDPEALVLRVDEAEGVAPEHVHVAVARRDATVAHRDRDLMQRLGQRGPEVPVVLRAPQVRAGIALHRAIEAGKT